MPDIRNEIIDNLQVRGLVSGGSLGSLAKAVRVDMSVATSGSNGIQVPDNSNLDMAINDFTPVWFGALPDWAPTSSLRNLFRQSSGGGLPGITFSVDNSPAGQLLMVLTGASTSTSINSTVATGLTAGAVAMVAAPTIRETPTADGSTTFYVNGTPLGAPVAIPAGTPFSVGGAENTYISGSSSARIASTNYMCLLYNRALTAAEVLSLYNNGPALADLGASQALLTNTESSTFEGGTVGSWIANSSGATVSVNSTTPISGVYDLSITSTGNGTSGGCIPISLINGKQYRIVFSYKAASGAWIPSIRDTTSASSAVPATIVSSPTITADGTVRQAVYVFTATATQTAYLHVRKSSETSLDTIYLDNFEARQIGITGMWDARDAQSDTGQILDSSGNKNHAMLPASGATVIGKPMSEARQVRWTNTWTGTNELQYIGGVNQAVLPAKAYIESIVGIVSGATVEDIIIGDGSDTDRYVALTTGLAAGTVTFTLANRTTDGTNLKLTVDPDANATMSIIWTVTYRILE